LALVAAFGLLQREPYHVETKVLFIESDAGSKGEEKTGRAVEREIELLKNREMVDFLAADTFRRLCSHNSHHTQGNAVLAEYAGAEAGTPTGTSEFRGSKEFAKWLGETLSFQTEASGGVGKVTLRLSGDQPDFLKTVMAAYLDGFAERRRLMETQARSMSQVRPRGELIESKLSPAKSLEEQIEKIELQRQRYQLALHFLDTGTGAFSGFMPDGSVTGASSLAHFQDRIVQLEIKKRGLAVQFTPMSREIRSVDLEIQGVKRAMRECLAEQIAFLKKGKEELLATHQAAETDSAPKSNHTGAAQGKSLSNDEVQDKNGWFVIKAGLFMLRDQPDVTKKPLLVKAGHLTQRLAGRLLPTRGGSSVAQAPKNSPTESKAITRNRLADQVEPEKGSVAGRASSAGLAPHQEKSRLSSDGQCAETRFAPTDTRQGYWECVPASHSGGKSLW